MGGIRNAGLGIPLLHDKHYTRGSPDVFEMTVSSGGQMPVPHYHQNWDETFYGVKGSLMLRVGDVETKLTPGQAIFIGRGVVHSFANVSDEAATCLCILTPGVLGPQYF